MKQIQHWKPSAELAEEDQREWDAASARFAKSLEEDAAKQGHPYGLWFNLGTIGSKNTDMIEWCAPYHHYRSWNPYNNHDYVAFKDLKTFLLFKMTWA
jgi:hypothetical protein